MNADGKGQRQRMAGADSIIIRRAEVGADAKLECLLICVHLRFQMHGSGQGGGEWIGDVSDDPFRKLKPRGLRRRPKTLRFGCVRPGSGGPLACRRAVASRPADKNAGGQQAGCKFLASQKFWAVIPGGRMPALYGRRDARRYITQSRL